MSKREYKKKSLLISLSVSSRRFCMFFSWSNVKLLFKQYNLQINFLLFIWASAITIFVFNNSNDISNARCPFVWHGGSPLFNNGSCWCGADKYCLCTPSLAIEAIIELSNGEEVKILLVKRKNPPHKYAIPGGFVNVGESVEDACRREVREETNLTITSMEQFHVYSKPNRDQRRHSASVIFRCKVDPTETPTASDDAKSVVIVSLTKALEMELGFDHQLVLKDFAKKYHPNIYNP